MNFHQDNVSMLMNHGYTLVNIDLFERKFVSRIIEWMLVSFSRDFLFTVVDIVVCFFLSKDKSSQQNKKRNLAKDKKEK